MRRARRFSIVALLFTLGRPSQAAPPGLKLEDVFELEGAAEPQLSPDGARLVYVRQFADIKTDGRYSNLWTMKADGSGHRPLTSGKHSDSSPRWSPDGTRLAYLSDRGGSAQIHVLWLDGGQTHAVTNLDQAPGGLAWSPDSSALAFFAVARAKEPELAKMPEKPKGASWADPPQVIDRLNYRFNGAGYLPSGYSQLFVVPAEGGTPRQLTGGKFHHGYNFTVFETPSWTPDGKSLLFSANRRADWELEPRDTEVYEVAAAGGEPRALTDRRGPDDRPVLSPDGKRIAYQGFDDRHQGYQVTRLYLLDREGGAAPRVLTAGLDRDAVEPAWAPDSSGVFFHYDDQGDSKLAFVSLDGSVRTLAGGLGGGASSYSSASRLSVARDGAVAFTIAGPDRPADVAIVPPGGALRRLTSLNDDLFSQRALGALEEIRYESAYDGRPIQGWVLKPPGFDSSRKYPLILEIHGGPFASYGPRFDIEKQIWAARDYVVFYANPRGSTGYGEEFGNLIHHRYPGDDFHDLNTGVDQVLARGYADKDRLFVTGGSGGGVLTCWLIGRTTRFRAAASAYPVIDWYSFVLTADMPALFTKYWFPGPPWEQAQHYHARSPISLVGNVQTPTLLITGEEDYRTPISESEQYYAALKLRGIEACLVRVPGEPHGLRRRPSHHIAKISSILEWFEKH